MARGIRKRLAEGDLQLPRVDASPRLRAYAEDWLEAGRVSWKATTHRFCRFNLHLHVLPVLGTRTVASLRRADCRDLITACRKKGLKTGSVRAVHQTLSAVLSQAVDDELLPANPAFRMGKYLRAGDDLPIEIQPLSRGEVQRLLAEVERSFPEHFPLFLCAVRTGLRLGEMLGLQWGDLDFESRFLEVRRSRMGARLTSPKSRQRCRVDMSQQLTAILRRLRTTRKKEALEAGTPMPPWVFLSADGQPLDGDNLRSRVFYRLLEQAGLRRIRLHDLRHTFATLLIEQGESLAYVQQQLGHSSIQVTVDVYGHPRAGANRAAVDRLDAPGRNLYATGAPAAGR